jgi:hypothetical protein
LRNPRTGRPHRRKSGCLISVPIGAGIGVGIAIGIKENIADTDNDTELGSNRCSRDPRIGAQPDSRCKPSGCALPVTQIEKPDSFLPGFYLVL